MDRNEFFAELDQLTPSQIEASLPSWDDEQLKLVEEYLQRGTIKPALLKQAAARSVRHEAAAVAMANKATTIATVALMIAIGAMLAAIVAGLAVYEALRRQ